MLTLSFNLIVRLSDYLVHTVVRGADAPEGADMVRIEVSDADNGRSFGRTEGIEACFRALVAAGASRYSIKRVGEAITKSFSEQAKECTIRVKNSREVMYLARSYDGGPGSVDDQALKVILWIDHE
jgi:hypothetical protein